MKTYWGVEEQFHEFLTSATGAEYSGQLHAQAALAQSNEPPLPIG
jgi:hypothetical protein